MVSVKSEITDVDVNVVAAQAKVALLAVVRVDPVTERVSDRGRLPTAVARARAEIELLWVSVSVGSALDR